MDSTEDVTLLVRWYARYGRTQELRLRAKQIELAVLIMDQLEPGWRDAAVPRPGFDDGRLPELDLNHARVLLAHIFPSH